MIVIGIEFIECKLSRKEEHLKGIELTKELVSLVAPQIIEHTMTLHQNGKPFIKDSGISFSVSHSLGCVACALSAPTIGSVNIPSLPDIVTENGVYLVDSDDTVCEVGFDVELHDSVRGKSRLDAIAKRYFSTDEASQVINSEDKISRFYKLWTEKESIIKCNGEGLSAISNTDMFKIRNIGVNVRHFKMEYAGRVYSASICSIDSLIIN